MALTSVTGVEITRAQGQAITSICSARISQPCSPQSGWPKSNGGTMATSAATAVTAGV